jgi:hypothetical protein
MYSRIKMERDLLKLSQEGGRGDKGEWWRRWIQLWHVVRTSVNVTPQYNNNINLTYVYFDSVQQNIYYMEDLLWRRYSKNDSIHKSLPLRSINSAEEEKVLHS